MDMFMKNSQVLAYMRVPFGAVPDDSFIRIPREGGLIKLVHRNGGNMCTFSVFADKKISRREDGDTPPLYEAVEVVDPADLGIEKIVWA